MRTTIILSAVITFSLSIFLASYKYTDREPSSETTVAYPETTPLASNTASPCHSRDLLTEPPLQIMDPAKDVYLRGLRSSSTKTEEDTFLFGVDPGNPLQLRFLMERMQEVEAFSGQFAAIDIKAHVDEQFGLFPKTMNDRRRLAEMIESQKRGLDGLTIALEGSPDRIFDTVLAVNRFKQNQVPRLRALGYGDTEIENMILFGMGIPGYLLYKYDGDSQVQFHSLHDGTAKKAYDEALDKFNTDLKLFTGACTDPIRYGLTADKCGRVRTLINDNFNGLSSVSDKDRQELTDIFNSGTPLVRSLGEHILRQLSNTSLAREAYNKSMATNLETYRKSQPNRRVVVLTAQNQAPGIEKKIQSNCVMDIRPTAR